MAQSDARFGYTAKFGREEHKLDRPFGFTTAPGMLCPIFADIATPGDTYYINHDLNFLRTAPLAAPAQIDVKVHYESFFVPFQMIYQPIENTVFSLKNFQSSMYSDPALLNNSLPLLNTNNYVAHIYGNPEPRTGNLHTNAYRFADLMDLNPYSFAIQNANVDTDAWTISGTSVMGYWPNYFPWKALAYHTIFSYYYRLDDKSPFDSFPCNWDQWYATALVNVDAYSKLYWIYQRPWDFDYFTSMYRSPIVSSENMQLISGYSPNSLNLGSNNPLTNNGVGTSVSNDTTTSFGGRATANYSASDQRLATSTAVIRQLFANEKLAMITGRARKNYDSQVLAHFGVNVPHDPKHNISMIGKDTYQLQIGEVTSLASTEGSPLGELAGKGWASGKGHNIKFTAPCHGVVMTIFSIEPVRRYVSTLARDSVVTTAFDLPVPEFDRLGNMPMFRYEIGTANGALNPTQVIGWKERYYFWKRRYPKVTTAFTPTDSTSIQVPNGTNNYSSYFLSYYPFGVKHGANSSFYSSERGFYIDTNAMDDIMLVNFLDAWQESESENWNKYPYLVYARDPFIVDSYEKVKKVSWMSKDGEPVYPY